MKIGIDIDGVMLDMQKYILDNIPKYFDKHGIEYTTHPEIYESKEMFEVSAQDYDAFWAENYLKYVQETLPREGLCECLEFLKKNGHEIHIVTARAVAPDEKFPVELIERMTYDWLDKHNLVYDEIVFTADKAGYIRENDIKVMIEDNPRNIEKIVQACDVICYECEYNKDVANKYENVILENNWFSITADILQLGQDETLKEIKEKQLYRKSLIEKYPESISRLAEMRKMKAEEDLWVPEYITRYHDLLKESFKIPHLSYAEHRRLLIDAKIIPACKAIEPVPVFVRLREEIMKHENLIEY